MDFIDTIKAWKDKLTQKEVSAAFLENRSKNTAQLPSYPVWFANPQFGIPRDTNVVELRQFARSGWVQTVTQAIKKAVLNTDWDIVVPEGEDDKKWKTERDYVKEFFENPNREEMQSYDHLISCVLSDLLEIDAGVLFMNMVDGKLLELIPYDGSTFLKELEPTGFVKRYWQYSYQNVSKAPKAFEPGQIAYFYMNKRTNYPYGYSPLQGIQQVIELMDASTRFNKDFFLNNAMPQFAMNFPGMSNESVDRTEALWKERHQGKNSSIGIHNAPDMKVERLSLSNRDMEWLDGQRWYMHLVFAAYGVSPSEVGFTDTTGSKSVQEGQERITIRYAHLPYLNLIERTLNRMVVPRILGEQELPMSKRTPVKFKYLPLDHQQKSMEEEAQRKDLMAGIVTVDEVRAARGLEPLKDEDLERQAEQAAAKAPPQVDVDPKKDDKKPVGKPGDKEDKKEKKAVDFVFKTATTAPIAHYETFFDRIIDDWQTQVVKALDELLASETKTRGGMVTRSSRALVYKDFSRFLSRLLRSIGSIKFFNIVKRAVKVTFEDGVDEAEKELDVNIVRTPAFDRAVDSLTKQQMDGYTMTSGDKWVGLKGVSQQVQTAVLNKVRDGLANRLSNDEIVAEVEGVFDGVKKSRARTIVRTESTRITNEAKLASYKASGVEGFKEYVAFDDERTSDICKHLHGQRRGFDESFDGPRGEHWGAPPTHPNCRSFVRFVRNNE